MNVGLYIVFRHLFVNYNLLFTGQLAVRLISCSLWYSVNCQFRDRTSSSSQLTDRSWANKVTMTSRCVIQASEEVGFGQGSPVPESHLRHRIGYPPEHAARGRRTSNLPLFHCLSPMRSIRGLGSSVRPNHVAQLINEATILPAHTFDGARLVPWQAA